MNVTKRTVYICHDENGLTVGIFRAKEDYQKLVTRRHKGHYYHKPVRLFPKKLTQSSRLRLERWANKQRPVEVVFYADGVLIRYESIRDTSV